MSTPLFYLFNDQVLVTKGRRFVQRKLREKNGLGRTGRGGDVHLEQLPVKSQNQNHTLSGRLLQNCFTLSIYHRYLEKASVAQQKSGEYEYSETLVVPWMRAEKNMRLESSLIDFKREVAPGVQELNDERFYVYANLANMQEVEAGLDDPKHKVELLRVRTDGFRHFWFKVLVVYLFYPNEI